MALVIALCLSCGEPETSGEPEPAAVVQATASPTQAPDVRATVVAEITATAVARPTETPTPPPNSAPEPTPTFRPVSMPIPFATLTVGPLPTRPAPTVTATPTPTATHTVTPTPTPTAANTPIPSLKATVTPAPTPTPTSEIAGSLVMDPSEIYANVSPSIAFISTTSSYGSGILIEGGYVVTNAHVVWPYNSVRVVFPDGSEHSEVPGRRLGLPSRFGSARANRRRHGLARADRWRETAHWRGRISDRIPWGGWNRLLNPQSQGA